MTGKNTSVFEIKSKYASNPERIFELAAESFAQKKFHRAKFLLHTLIKEFPIKAEYYSALGTVCRKLKELHQAEQWYTKAYEKDPNFYEAYYNLGLVYCGLKKKSEEIDSYLKAIKIRPDLYQAYYNVGTAYWSLGDYDKAEYYYKYTISLNPTHSDAYYNLGVIYERTNRYLESLECYERAVQINAENGQAIWNKVLLKLKLGNFKEGLEEYECRKDLKSVNTKKLTDRLLINQNIEGRKILVYSEQGLGDNIQFFRYLKLLKDKGAFVIFECNPKLYHLFNGHEYIDKIILQTDKKYPEVDYDYQIALMSLPKYFNTTINSIPNEIPYLFARQDKIKEWAAKIDNNKFKIGIAWAGALNNPLGESRSCPFNELSQLFAIDSVEFYSLQKIENKNKIVNENVSLIEFEEFDQVPFIDSAAIISNMDLVISVDTSIAHLSGAMGKATWIMLPSNSDWRWFIDKDDSPWYPSVKLFRQEKEGNWMPVISKIAEGIKKIAAPENKYINKQAIDNYSTLEIDSSNVRHQNKNKLILGFSSPGDFGWGVVCKYLKKEISSRIKIHNVLDDGTPSLLELKESKVFQLLKDVSLNPAFEICGRENYGYTVFENELSASALSNSYRYDKVVTASTWNYNKLKEAGIKNVELLIQGIATELFYPRQVQRDENLFTVFSGGKLELRKGQDLVLKAISILQKKYGNLVLINSWYNEWPSTIKSLARSKHIVFSEEGRTWQEFINNIYALNNIDTSRVITLPIVPHNKLSEVYLKTDIGLFPNRCEGGTNLVMMEYMACGRPVIASYNTGQRDILTESNSIMLKEMKPFRIYDSNKILTADWEEPNLDEIISKIEYAYDNKKELARLGNQAGKDLKKFDWSNVADKLINIVGF